MTDTPTPDLTAPERILMDADEAKWLCAERFPDHPEDKPSISYVLESLHAARIAELKAEVDRLQRALALQLGSVLYPEDRHGYKGVLSMRAQHAKEREIAFKTYTGAKNADEALAMSHSAALSVIRGARLRLDKREKIARAALDKEEG